MRNITRNVEERHLKEMFEVYSKVKSVEIPRDSRMNNKLEYAIVHFEDIKEAETGYLRFDGA